MDNPSVIPFQEAKGSRMRCLVIKPILVSIVGLFLAFSGGYLRFNAEKLSTHITSSSPVTDSDGKQIGIATSSEEDKSKTAALNDIALVLLYSGSALCVAAAAAWLFKAADESAFERH